MARRRILWSGGFDSTWLVVDALLQGAQVEAITMRGWGLPADWQKVINEDRARARVTAGLPNDLRRRLVTDTAEATHRERRYAWEELEDATRKVRGTFVNQDYALVGLADTTGPIETGFVADDFLNPRLANDEIRAVMARHQVALPIAGLAKAELLVDAQRRGFEDLLLATWSCEAAGEGPIYGLRTTPCGKCQPCRARVTSARSD